MRMHQEEREIGSRRQREKADGLSDGRARGLTLITPTSTGSRCVIQTRHTIENYKQKWQGKTYFASWFTEPLNNARLALFNTYEGSFCAFRGLWDLSEGDWYEFHRLAEQKSRLPKDQRREWLMQTCDEIALQSIL